MHRPKRGIHMGVAQYNVTSQHLTASLTASLSHSDGEENPTTV